MCEVLQTDRTGKSLLYFTVLFSVGEIGRTSDEASIAYTLLSRPDAVTVIGGGRPVVSIRADMLQQIAFVLLGFSQ